MTAMLPPQHDDGSLPTSPPASGASSPSDPQNTNSAQKSQNTVRAPFTPGRFVVWIGALGVLWLILTAIAESGHADLARGIAGLILMGALLALGPGAIGNAKGLVSNA